MNRTELIEKYLIRATVLNMTTHMPYKKYEVLIALLSLTSEQQEYYDSIGDIQEAVISLLEKYNLYEKAHKILYNIL